MLGLFNQEKLFPLRYCPLQIEFEFDNSQADAVVLENEEGFSNGYNWYISNIQCECDFLTLDNSLDNEYASHFFSGKSFPINFNTWNHTNQSIGNDKNFSAHITRAVIHLSPFISLVGLHTSKLTIFTIRTIRHPSIVKCLLLMSIHIKFKSAVNPSPDTRSLRRQKATCNLRKRLVELLRCFPHGIVVESISLDLILKRFQVLVLHDCRLRQATY